MDNANMHFRRIFRLAVPQIVSRFKSSLMFINEKNPLPDSRRTRDRRSHQSNNRVSYEDANIMLRVFGSLLSCYCRTLSLYHIYPGAVASWQLAPQETIVGALVSRRALENARVSVLL